jgi:hypothetical protein
VQTAGYLVTFAAELAAGVKFGHDDLDGRTGVLVLHGADGDAATVVPHLNRRIGTDGDLDVVAIARQGLVDGVVDNLVHEMVQSPVPGRPDVHAGPLAHRFQAFEYLDVTRVVCVFRQSSATSQSGL